MKSLLWLRRDLRLQDNPALTAALSSGLPVEALFIYPDDPDHPLAEGSAARWYLHHSLLELQRRLADLGAVLHLRRGDPEIEIAHICAQRSVTRLFYNRVVEPRQAVQDKAIKAALEGRGIQCELMDDDGLVMPEAGRKANGEPYRVFTPFWRNHLVGLQGGAALARRLSPAPQPVASPVAHVPGEVNALALLDSHPWHHKLQAHWQPGEDVALQRLADFIDHSLADYNMLRDRPDLDATSRLSPALHFGEISVARVFVRIDELVIATTSEKVRDSMQRFLAELGWREFGRHVLWHFPQTLAQSLNPRFDQPEAWEPDPGDRKLQAWQRGETGIALIDAGMRQLWETGWMHNRVRMVAASFLTKNLSIHWHQGAQWFADTLVDADAASNTLGWQWVAGCGTDAAPYYRIFNPDTQAKKFDPEGRYISRWLGDRPLLATPIVDLKTSRERALARYQNTIRRATA
ncbi:MAG: cryptochrome/photolyase family protein [bacterium]